MKIKQNRFKESKSIVFSNIGSEVFWKVFFLSFGPSTNLILGGIVVIFKLKIFQRIKLLIDSLTETSAGMYRGKWSFLWLKIFKNCTFWYFRYINIPIKHELFVLLGFSCWAQNQWRLRWNSINTKKAVY